MTEQDAWLRPLLAKRTPDAIIVLMDLIQAALKNGHCSANDIQPRDWSQPNIIGGVFKILPKFGLLHTEKRIKSTAKQKHARRVDVWVLEDAAKAEAFVQYQRRLLVAAGGTGQLSLGL